MQTWEATGDEKGRGEKVRRRVLRGEKKEIEREKEGDPGEKPGKATCQGNNG